MTIRPATWLNCLSWITSNLRTIISRGTSRFGFQNIHNLALPPFSRDLLLCAVLLYIAISSATIFYWLHRKFHTYTFRWKSLPAGKAVIWGGLQASSEQRKRFPFDRLCFQRISINFQSTIFASASSKGVHLPVPSVRHQNQLPGVRLTTICWVEFILGNRILCY